MYMTTSEGLRQGPQIPVASASLPGTLGDTPKIALPPEIRKFLEQVRKRPQDHKKLLLTVTFHPKPIESDIDVVIPGWPRKLLDVGLIAGFAPDDLRDEQRLIRDDAFRDGNKKVNQDFRRQIDAEFPPAEARNARSGSLSDRPDFVDRSPHRRIHSPHWTPRLIEFLILRRERTPCTLGSHKDSATR